MKRWRCALTGHRQTRHPYPADPTWTRCECNRVTTPRAPHIDAISPGWQAAEERAIEQMYRCGSCRHFQPGPAVSEPSLRSGLCRRYPPRTLVTVADSCGEWATASYVPS